MAKPIELKWGPEEWSNITNDVYLPYTDNLDRILILWGGRASGKSDFISKKIIYLMLKEPYFRGILIRNTFATIKDSQYQTVKDNIIELGLESLFEFTVNPLQIKCVNGNLLYARGMDEPAKIKSIKDPTTLWFEEEVPDSEEDFITNNIHP